MAFFDKAKQIILPMVAFQKQIYPKAERNI